MLTKVNWSWNYTLREVEITPFDGKSDLWSEFYDNFQCAIYQTSLLNDIQKNDIFEKLS